MRITLQTDYALRVLVFLAVRPAERVPTRTIADAYGISFDHLHKVVRALAGLGLVELRRGVGGGVELAVDPRDVSVGEVVRALDDDTALVECFRAETDECAISPACTLKGALRDAQEAFYAALDVITIGDVVRGRRGAKLRGLLGES